MIWHKQFPKLIQHIAKGMSVSNGLNNYLELGVFRGRTFNRVAPYAKNAYAVDMKKVFYKYIAHNENLVWYRCTTDEFFEQLDENTMFDLVFIDANHSRENSMRDFKNSFKHLNGNGIILLHDTYPPDESQITDGINGCGTAYQTALEIKQEWGEVCEITTLPFWFGISIVRKISNNVQLYWKGE